jgi:diphthamide biosynthesis protein 3
MKRETLAAIYTPETRSALSHYREHLSDASMRLEERRKNALSDLEAYAAADSGSDQGEAPGTGSQDNGGTGNVGRRNITGAGAAGPMVEIARRYGALVKEVEGVRMEIRRLGG